MNDFKLPDIYENMPSSRVLSMDEYYNFVRFNLKNAFDRQSYLKWKKMMVVDVAFSLK